MGEDIQAPDVIPPGPALISSEETPGEVRKSKRKYKTRNILTPAQWIQVRALYEFGEYSLNTISETWGVGMNTLERRCAAEGWTGKRMAAAVQQRVEESTIAIFTRLGMPKEKYLEMITKDMKGMKTIRNVKEVLKDKRGRPLKSKDGKPLVLERSVEIIDNLATLEHRKEYAKLTGLYSAPKQAIENPDTPGDDIRPIVTQLKEATEEYNADPAD